MNVAMPVAAGQIDPTNDPAVTVPTADPPLHERLFEPTEMVVGPLVAVNAVLPVLCHVTAWAAEEAIANNESSAASATPSRMVLDMVMVFFRD
ncbi:hypothetical protein [Baekduia sp. Peel2402]|uniref:hypothetical protein n=1 Tax=Baekduia sp. Peel2402 TaxID=3458296 RepID=UPI00403E8D5D